MLFFLKSKEKPYSKSSGKEVENPVIKIKTFIKNKGHFKLIYKDLQNHF
jgi:hypothetical protein